MIPGLAVGGLCSACWAKLVRRARRISQWVAVGTTLPLALYMTLSLPHDRTTRLVDSASGTITRTYDGLDRVTSETTAQGAVSYAYDAASRRTGLTIAGSPPASYAYGYDAADRPTSLVQGTAAVALTYDAAGHRSTLTLPNGICIETEV